jgi:hypothetical protein
MTSSSEGCSPDASLDEVAASLKCLEETSTRPLVYLAYSYHSTPHYIAELREDLGARGFMVFDPLARVGEQFSDEKDIVSLTSRTSPVMQADIQLPPSDPRVVATLQRGDERADIDSMIFKELYFLARSSVLLCDLVLEPHGCELFHKIFYAKMLGVPAIGISPLGKGVSAYIQKYIKVLLTDDFSTDNIVPLIKAYTSS